MDIHKNKKNELYEFEDRNSVLNLNKNNMKNISKSCEYDNSKSLKEKNYSMEINNNFNLNGVDNSSEIER